MSCPTTRILLVEDNPGDARLIEYTLREGATTAACAVKLAGTLSDSLDMLRRGAADGQRFGLVLLDLNLPDSRGLETLCAVRTADPLLPVIVLTGADDEELGLEAIKAGAQDFLVKGRVGVDSLSRAIRYAIERSRIDAELRAGRDALARISRLSALGEMAATFAHELNQPLSAILLCTENLRRLTSIDADSAMSTELKIISTQCRRAADVIRRIKGFAGRSEWAETKFGALILESVELVRPEFAQRGVRVVTELAADLPGVMGDAVQFKQVMVNLLFNAAEAMSDVAAEMRVVVIRANADGHNIRVSVADLGRGVPPADAARIMEPFFSTKAEGLGLGLSISRSIVESHAGRLWLEPNDPCGSVLCFTLPYQPTTSPKLSDEAVQQQYSGTDLTVASARSDPHATKWSNP